LIGQRFAAEATFRAGLVQAQEPDNFVAVNNTLNKAIRLNKYRDTFYRNLAQLYVVQIEDEAKKLQTDDETAKAQATRNVQLLIDGSINTAKQATNLSPNNVANWNVLANMYEKVLVFVEGADEWAINSYNKAIELEPNNPIYYTNLAKVYIAQNDIAMQKAQAEDIDDATKASLEAEAAEALLNAEEKLKKAIEIKVNYAPAHYQLAMVHVRKGDTAAAIEEFEVNRAVDPKDVGIAFQLGLLYYQNNEKDKAIAELERTITLAPNYSNARWYLASIYEEQNDIDLAIEQIEKVLEVNPDNQLVKDKLQALRTGTSTTSPPLPEPVEEDIEESSTSTIEALPEDLPVEPEAETEETPE